jgi:predicted lipid-binding transport protein (Tim44 family)
MNEILDPINIVILVVAVVVLYRLYSVLGEKTGSEEAPPERPARNVPPRDTTAPDAGEAVADNVIPMPGRAGEEPREMTALDRALAAIISADRQFDKVQFLEGAAAAYEMIVMSFAEGDKRALKPLLSAEVYDGFQKAIDQRVAAGEVVATTFVGLDNAEIVEAATQGRLARIKVRFVAKMINVTHDRDGNVISGDPQRIETLRDGWTFERTMGTSDPNWFLVATESME